jgi:hypothetical protein
MNMGRKMGRAAFTIASAQGLRPDGSSSAALSFVKAIQSEMARLRQKQIDRMKRDKLKLYHDGQQLIRLRKWTHLHHDVELHSQPPKVVVIEDRE